MWRYIVRRLLWVVVVLLVVTSITYVVFFVMPSTDPAVTFAGNLWGLGKRWARLGFVQRNRWLI